MVGAGSVPYVPYDGDGRSRQSGEDALGRWLRAAGADVVYAELARDGRLFRAGRAPLTPAVFEMGPEGALRAAELVLDLATMASFGRSAAR